MSYLIIMINNLPKVFCHPKNTRKIIPIFKREAKRGSLVKVKVTQSCLTLCDPHGLYSPWNSPGQNIGRSSLSLLQGIFPTQGSNPEPPELQVDSLPAEPPGKPKNTGVGSLSLLQKIFPIQELNRVSCCPSPWGTSGAWKSISLGTRYVISCFNVRVSGCFQVNCH